MGEIADALKQALTSETAVEPPPPRRESNLSAGLRRNLRDMITPQSEAAPAIEQPAIEGSRIYHLRRDAEGERDENDPWRPARIAISEPYGPATQQYRRLAFRVRDLADARGARSIVVTSAESGDGKTTTSCNLAVQLVSLDQDLRVVLVDLDLRRASIAAAFGIQPEVPISDVLNGERKLEEAVLETDVPGLSILGQSAVAKDPEWLLANANLRMMIGDLERRFDFVIIDTPPVLAVSDAQVLLRHASAGLFVARSGQTPVRAIRRAFEHLPKKKLIGSFMNSSPGYHGFSGYDAYYGTGGQPTPDDTPSAELETGNSHVG